MALAQSGKRSGTGLSFLVECISKSKLASKSASKEPEELVGKWPNRELVNASNSETVRAILVPQRGQNTAASIK